VGQQIRNSTGDNEDTIHIIRQLAEHHTGNGQLRLVMLGKFRTKEEFKAAVKTDMKLRGLA